MPCGANVTEVEMIANSTKISQRPRLHRNAPSSRGDLRAAMSPAEVPARNTNTGAQKWVIQRVRYSEAGTSGWFMGSSRVSARKNLARGLWP